MRRPVAVLRRPVAGLWRPVAGLWRLAGSPRPAAALVGALLALGVLAGCSQEQAIAPVAGDDITRLRIAVDDALAEAGVAVLVWPICREEDGVTRCTGTTRGGGTIEAESGPDADRLTVRADDRTIYDGSITEIVQRAAEVAP